MAQAGPALLPYFDIPVQHAHPDILRSMGRPFAQDPRKVLDLVRSRLPGAVARTTLIVGYPGEKARHFKYLLDFVAEARFQHLGVFAYQAEEGTPAARLPGQVAMRLRCERREAVMALQAGLCAAWLKDFEGRRLPVLVDAPSPEWPGLHLGRAWFQAPEIDGVTYVSGPGVEPGAMVTAEVVEAKTYDLVALSDA
jgi:ribosomal protein S12 methylthiotransferase